MSLQILNCSLSMLQEVAPGRYPWVGLGATPRSTRRSDGMVEWTILQFEERGFVILSRSYPDEAVRYMRHRERQLERFAYRSFNIYDFIFNQFRIIFDVDKDVLLNSMGAVALMQWCFH